MPAQCLAAAAAAAAAATETGGREISRHRLAHRGEALQQAAAMLQAANADALTLEHPDPLAVSLAAMAVQIRAHHTDLHAWATLHPDPAELLLGARRLPGGAHDQAADAVGGPGADEADGFAAAGTVLTDQAPGTDLDLVAVDGPAEDVAPAWARPLFDETASWLLTGYTSENSRTTAANARGIPRTDQRWRGTPPRAPPPRRTR